MDRKYKATFLLDSKNNWLHPYILKSRLLRNIRNYKFTISYDCNAIRNQDIVFILGYTRILSKIFLNSNRLNLVVHESNLPNGKGFSPIQWQILKGAKSIPICLFEAKEKVDSGSIFLKSRFFLDGFELYDEIRLKQACSTIKLISNFLRNYPYQSKRAQFGYTSFFPRRMLAASELDINKSIKSQFNLLRICNNSEWPSFFIYEGKKYLLKIYPET